MVRCLSLRVDLLFARAARPSDDTPPPPPSPPLLVGAHTEMLALSEKGDNSVVDMLVGDIYGADYSKLD